MIKYKQQCFIFFFLLSIHIYGQKVKFSVFTPPLKSTDLYYSDFNQYVMPSSLFCMVTVPMVWSQIETSKGVYNFSTFDAQLQQFISAGKTVNIVTWPVGAGNVNTNTPQYVFTLNWASQCGYTPIGDSLTVVTCAQLQGNGNPTTGMPVVYQKPFMRALQRFDSAVIAHYNNVSFLPQIGYIRLGAAVGGDFYPRCSSSYINPVYSITQWENYANAMSIYQAAQNPLMPLVQSVMLTGAAAEASNAISNGIGIGIQGWEISDNANCNTATSDWCNLFNTYQNSGLPLELQTINYSTADGVTTSTNPTGALTDLIPFAAKHHAQVLELYLVDWLLALDPNYATLTGPDIVPSYATYATAYKDTITAYTSCSGGGPLGVNKNKLNKKTLTISPNPVQNTINFESFSPSWYKQITINVNTLDGKNVMKKVLNLQSEKTLDVLSLSRGMYFVQIINEEGIILNYKIVKE